MHSDKRKQIVFYQSGVGSEANFAGDQVTGTTAMRAYVFTSQQPCIHAMTA